MRRGFVLFSPKRHEDGARRSQPAALGLHVAGFVGGDDDHIASAGNEASTLTGVEASVVPIEASVDAALGDEQAAADAALDAGHYDPCAAKSCGAPCTVCDPHDPHCVEPPGQKQCNAHDQCVTTPICPADAGNTTG
jgi:hypothetical protein